MKEIPLTQGKVALIDDEDFELVSQYKWRVLSHPGLTDYAKTTCAGKWLSMHRLILKPSPDRMTDHKNGNGLDNRRSNLRPATSSQNNANNRKQRRLTGSRFKGVSWHRARNKWQAKIKYNKKYKHLGYFTTEISAAIAYDKSALILFGEYARPNLLPRVA